MREHDGKDDDEGERIDTKECGTDYRLYTVSPGQLIKVTIKNLSSKPLSFQPVYVHEDGSEEPEDFIQALKQGEVCVCVYVCVCACVRSMSTVDEKVCVCARARVGGVYVGVVGGCLVCGCDKVCLSVTGVGEGRGIGAGLRAAVCAPEGRRRDGKCVGTQERLGNQRAQVALCGRGRAGGRGREDSHAGVGCDQQADSLADGQLRLEARQEGGGRAVE